MDGLRQAWRNLPLSRKLATVITMVIVGVVLIISLVSVQRELTSFRQDLEEQATLLLETLPLTMRDQLYQLELDELLDISRVVSGNPDVTLFKVYDSKGALLVDSNQDTPVFSQNPDPEGVTILSLAPDAIDLDWQPDQLVASRSIWLGNEAIGALSIGLSRAEFEEKLTALVVQSVLIALATIVLGIALASVLARRLNLPVLELTTIASEMANGDLSNRVKREADDEVGQLGRAFNQMADAIQKRDTELRESAEKLEKTVEARTAELRENVQKLVQTNAALEIARREAEEATRLKSQFLATMSHELRTPLNAIMGFSQLLLAGTSGELNDKQQEKLDRVLKNAKSLLDLINDLLDLAKIEAGRTELVKKPFKVEDWLNNIKQQLDGLATEKGIDLKTKLANDMPDTIVGDPTRLKQITVNLVSNAIKFTEEGSVTIDVKLREKDEWSIIVTDTGVGIPSHAQEFIFEEFRQVDGTSRRKHGGTGLGLAIVRNLAILMGGTVRLTSEVGKGSTFSVHLPLVTSVSDIAGKG